MLKDLRIDLDRYRQSGESRLAAFVKPAFWPVFGYRFGYWAHQETSWRWLHWPAKVAFFFFEKFSDIFWQVQLAPPTRVGAGLLLSHLGSLRVHPEVVIGRNCSLGHQVTIGTKGLGGRGAPRLGDDVYVGTGATIIGRISIGDGARIAANSLVNRDVPAGATVMGVPAQIVKRNLDAGAVAAAVTLTRAGR
ncbi:MAG: serine O-acetyltransferase [Terriglobales bacterium]